jgi:hypothetical protein
MSSAERGPPPRPLPAGWGLGFLRFSTLAMGIPPSLIYVRAVVVLLLPLNSSRERRGSCHSPLSPNPLRYFCTQHPPSTPSPSSFHAADNRPTARCNFPLTNQPQVSSNRSIPLVLHRGPYQDGVRSGSARPRWPTLPTRPQGHLPFRARPLGLLRPVRNQVD